MTAKRPAACDAELAGQRCEREAGHPGFHMHGDDRKVEGLTAWGDSAAKLHRWPLPARTWRSKRAWLRAWLRTRLRR